MFIGAADVVITKFAIIYKLYLILVSANWYAHLDSRQMAKWAYNIDVLQNLIIKLKTEDWFTKEAI